MLFTTRVGSNLGWLLYIFLNTSILFSTSTKSHKNTFKLCLDIFLLIRENVVSYGWFVSVCIYLSNVNFIKYKHNAELRGTTPGANIPKSMFLWAKMWLLAKEISTQEAQCSVSDTTSVEQFYTISPCPHCLSWNFWYSSSLGQKEKKIKTILKKNWHF